MSQLSFASLRPKTNRPVKSETFLGEMKRIIPWESMCDLIHPFYHNNTTGRPPMDLLLMIRIYCLQQWFCLSDPGAEEAISDRLSFQRFLEIDLMEDRIPDETTILNFRRLLEEHNLTMKLMEAINVFLLEKGLLMKQGTIVDATLIAAPSSTKNQEQKRDPEMSSTRKNGKWHFGMKLHLGVDSSSGLAHSCTVTTAKTSDKTEMPNLLHGEEQAVFGDKGYIGDEDKRKARDVGVFWGVLDKSKPRRKLSSTQKKRNRKLSSIRAKVEHPFHVIKNLWGYWKVRYRGLRKNACQIFMLVGLANIYRMRRKLLPGC